MKLFLRAVPLSFLVASSSCTTAPSLPEPPAFSEQTIEGVDRLFERFRGDGPGCALGIFEHGGRRYVAGYGMADIEHEVPITPRSIFAVASVSKQFTAMSVMLLVQQHKVSLEESIRRIIPELPVAYAPITLRHLLTHTSGLPEYEDIYNEQGGPDYDSATRTDQLHTIIAAISPASAPGTETTYANTNYLLAAIAVERISGNSLETFARRRIFNPLGMADSRFVSHAAITNPMRARPYQAEGDSFREISYRAHLGPTGLQTSILDLERWAENFFTPIVGTSNLLAQMQFPSSLNDGTPTKFGLGLENKQLGSHHVILHTGVTVGTRAAFARFPDHKISIAILCNRIDVNTERMITEIADQLFR